MSTLNKREFADDWWTWAPEWMDRKSHNLRLESFVNNETVGTVFDEDSLFDTHGIVLEDEFEFSFSEGGSYGK